MIHGASKGGLLALTSASPPATLAMPLLSLPIPLRVLALSMSLRVVVWLATWSAAAIATPAIPSSTGPALTLSLPAAGRLIRSSIHRCFISSLRSGRPSLTVDS